MHNVIPFPPFQKKRDIVHLAIHKYQEKTGKPITEEILNRVLWLIDTHSYIQSGKTISGFRYIKGAMAGLDTHILLS